MHIASSAELVPVFNLRVTGLQGALEGDVRDLNA